MLHAVEHVRVDRRRRHHLRGGHLARRRDGPAQREAIGLDLFRSQLLVRATSIRHSARGSNRVAISRARSLSSIDPRRAGRAPRWRPAPRALRWLCRSTAGAIAVPSCATGMSAIRPVRLGSSPFRPGAWAYARTEEHADTNTTAPTHRAQSSILVLRIGPPSTFRLPLPPCKLLTNAIGVRDFLTPARARAYIPSRRCGDGRVRSDARRMRGVRPHRRVGAVAVAKPPATRRQRSRAPSSRSAVLHHVAQREIALGLLAQVAAVRPETMRFATELETDFRLLDRRILAIAEALGIGENRLRQAYADQNTVALDGQADDSIVSPASRRELLSPVLGDGGAGSARRSDLLAAAAGTVSSPRPLVAGQRSPARSLHPQSRSRRRPARTRRPRAELGHSLLSSNEM